MFRKKLVELKKVYKILEDWPSNKKIVLASFFSIISAILQSAGGLLPGAGFLISPFSTLPIVLSTALSVKHGLFTYLLSIILLVLIEPSELIIFSFTTGLMGLAIGWTLRLLRRQLPMALISGFVLLIGILIPLYGLGFPVLGPILSSSPNIKNLSIILLFSLIYSWLWVKLSIYALSLLHKILVTKNKPLG